MKGKFLSCARLLATPWTAAYQAPPSMGYSRQEYWSGVPLPSPHKQVKIQKLGGSLAAFKRRKARYPLDDKEQKCDGFPKQKDEGTFKKPHAFHASQRVKLNRLVTRKAALGLNPGAATNQLCKLEEVTAFLNHSLHSCTMIITASPLRTLVWT